jgi:periplasmic protein TonB
MASTPALQALPSAAVATTHMTHAPRLNAIAPAAPVAQRPPTLRQVVSRQERRVVLLGVGLAHVAGLVLLSQVVTPPAPPAPSTITAMLIELPKAMPLEAPPPPPRRAPEKPSSREKVAPPPRPAPPPSTPRVESPTAVAAPAPAQPPAPAEIRPAPVAADPVVPAKPAPVAAPAPAPVTPVRFDAAYLNNPAPAYPPLSRRMREEGKVMLRVQVTAEGLPARVELAESSGFGRLDQAAREAVQRWRFVPAKQDGHAVEAGVIVPIIFKLEGN